MSGSKKTFLYILVIVLLALFIGGGNPLQAAAPGEVIVNEIMQNPAAVGDSAGEWFELYNTTGADIDIKVPLPVAGPQGELSFAVGSVDLDPFRLAVGNHE